MTRRKLHKVRDADATKLKLLNAVGELLTAHGYSAIKVNRIARHIRMDKTSIRNNFGNLNGLLRKFIDGRDYWKPFFEKFRLSAEPDGKEIERLFIEMMKENFRMFSTNVEMQKLIHWQISEDSPLMKSISDEREREGAGLLDLATPYFPSDGLNFKAIIALILGGTYFMVLQHQAINGVVCGIDLNNERHRRDVLFAIEKIISMAWSHRTEVQEDKLNSTKLMNYEFEQLEIISDELLKNPSNRSAFTRLERELRRLERTLLRQLMELSSEIQLANFLQINLFGLTEICDLHFSDERNENPVAEMLLALIDRLSSQVEQLLPPNLILPKLFAKHQSTFMKIKWVKILERLEANGADENLLKIMSVPVERFGSGVPTCWQDYKYLKKYIQILDEQASNETLEGFKLVHLLVGLGFNHVRFENYFTKILLEEVENLHPAEAKLKLKDERTKLFQAVLYTKMVFEMDRPPIDEALGRWIDTTLKSLSEKLQGIETNQLKLKTRLTKIQLALFQKSLFDIGFYDENNLEIFSEKIAHNYSTKEKEVLTGIGFRSKMLEKDEDGVLPFESMLEVILSDLKQY